MNASNTLKKLGIEQTFNYIYKDPDKNMERLNVFLNSTLQE